MTATIQSRGRGRPKARYCSKGHDTDVVGRLKSGTCSVCQLDHIANRDRQRDAGLLPPRRLRRYVTSRGWSWEYVTALYVSERQVSKDSAERAVHRLKVSKGLNVDQADLWCIVLGTHLAIVYPELYRRSYKRGVA